MIIPAKKLGLASARHVKTDSQNFLKKYNWLMNW